ncbi:Peroxyureidoacrylate/ureidoacrylate amidohydrolase [Lachnellula hyalina]|uniref:Peroxyureidoacrylate/ureidoacrylate amidohydrolase n=1 Tax=Lachnellula hyalina TaxID=1316788 RepID=A0A8H8R8T8_9HELO|nr:Peroxyureidoacrylate/ureidoacrylate amidohydrolase [Lachnellula hyalina]TVY30108.1 Peroxyureidoacrylate/ureidoacrylate amidohydrolase [Lachnellula hyalina]
MNCSSHYSESIDNDDRTNTKLVHFHQMSNDDPPEKAVEPSIRPSPYWNLFTCFDIFRPRKTTKLNAEQARRLDLEQRTSTPSIITALSFAKMGSQVDATPYAWPISGGMNPMTTALVIIDMQKDFCSSEGYLVHQGYSIAPARAVIPRIKELLTIFRTLNFPIYHTREGHRPDLSTLSARELARSRNNPSGLGIGDKGPLGRLLVRGESGHDIIPELYPLEGEQIIDKPGRSAFQHTDFKLMLNIRGIKNLVICGVTTDVCVHSTMREANDNNFDCLLVEDASAASEELLHAHAVESVKAEGGIFGAVATVDKVLEALGAKQAGMFANDQIKNDG